MKKRYEYGVCHTDRYNPETFTKNYKLIESIAPQMLHSHEDFFLVGCVDGDSERLVTISHRGFDEYEGNTLRICDPYITSFSSLAETIRVFDPNNLYFDGDDIRCDYDFYILVDNEKKMVRVKGRWWSEFSDYEGWDVKSVGEPDHIEEPCRVVEDDYDPWGEEEELDINDELTEFLEWVIQFRKDNRISDFAVSEIENDRAIAFYSHV